MITCERCDWRGYTSDLAEHEYVDHGIGSWGGPDCGKCGGEGQYLASRVARWDGEEDWRTCGACGGTGVA